MRMSTWEDWARTKPVKDSCFKMGVQNCKPYELYAALKYREPLRGNKTACRAITAELKTREGRGEDMDKRRPTEVYKNGFSDGLSKTCKYRDYSGYYVCYFHENPREITTCEGCREDGGNTVNGTDRTAFAQRGDEIL